MSEDSDFKPYCFPGLEDQDGASGCRASMAQLHRMGAFSQGRPDLGLPSEGSDSSGQDRPASPDNHRKNPRSRSLPEEDVEMKSSGSSGSGTESHGNESHGNESHGNDSNGHESMGSSTSNSKDSALLESSESNKSSNSHSPSPPSSSNAFSLLSSEQDNPSTSGCSSEESAKAKTQKEVIKTLKELKLHLPADKRHNNKSTTLNTLKYALRCVKQVEANEEYYQLLMINDSQPSGLDVSSYTMEEIDSITSEYTLKNNDMFAVAVSLITGRIVYISDQAASILNCKRDVFRNTKFVEFLTPQDVSVFYSFTTPYRLPSWSMCTGAAEPSAFRLLSCGIGSQPGFRRLTPSLILRLDLKLAFFLKIIGIFFVLIAPRIPTDKRIFTTTHSPSCVFQDVDERAVPLLGYLPQELIGTPVLSHLHPSDRPIMLAIHRKILQYAGQPFDHSSIRFCARNGEYIILDTSWSSFVNPWSRKVSFVIGRHKVRMGPVNEDIFMGPVSGVREVKTMDSDVQEITEQIHRLLLQPVHNSGSSGYGSLHSNDHFLDLGSSNESLSYSKMHQEEEEMRGKARPRTFQEICKGIHLQKREEQQTSIQKKSQAVVRPKESTAPVNWREAGSAMEESRASFQEDLAFNDQTVYSYQQISCLDSVIRYLESCNVPITMKRKCQSLSNTTSSNSDEDKQKGSSSMQVSNEPSLLKDQSGLSALDDQEKKSTDAATAVVGTSRPLPVPNKPESVVSITSQCSYSSTIVHVGDKKPQPESEIIEDVLGAVEVAESSQNLVPPPCAFSPPSQERECYKKLGLTKQVLAAHTQKEEQAFLCRFRELRKLSPLEANCSEYLERQKEQIGSDVAPAVRPKQGGVFAEPTTRRSTRNKKTKSKRAKQVESSDSTASHHGPQLQRPPFPNYSLNQTSWSPSEASQSAFPVAYPTVMPGYPLQVYPRAESIAPRTDGTTQDFRDSQGAQATPGPSSIHSAPYTSPMVTPIVALVLPNYLYPIMGPGPPPQQPVYQAETGVFPTQTLPFAQAAFPFPPSFSGQTQFNTQSNFTPPQAAGTSTPSFCFPPSSETPKPSVEGQSRSSTPQSGGAEGQASPRLFQSRCSSPLNLLELELNVDRQDGAMLPSGGRGNTAAEREQATSSQCDANNSDANSSSSDMLNIILQEDSFSGTGSATSGSMGYRTSASGTSNSGTSEGRTSAKSTNSSKYFGSVDSSQHSQKVKGHLSGRDGRHGGMEQSDHITKYVLQDPLWLLMANTDEKVMMTYQLPSRDIEKVLREDKEKLRLLQKSQPRFSEEQKKELIEVHPWIKKGGLPKAIDIKVELNTPSRSDIHTPDLDLGESETAGISCHGSPSASDSRTQTAAQ
uniref:Period circadian protein homolog 2 n=1 Tax=Oreochromis niloticus TaxID=8128 RepID=A0A669CF81_ORENI